MFNFRYTLYIDKTIGILYKKYYVFPLHLHYQIRSKLEVTKFLIGSHRITDKVIKVVVSTFYV